MPDKLLLPKFLNKEKAEEAIRLVSKFATTPPMLFDTGEREMFHVAILVPAMKDDGGESYPNYPIQPHLLAELGFGDKKKWPYDFGNIARCKALQLWHDRNDGGTDIKPHLLFPGDTPFWGGVKRDSIVVTCSGLQPYFDRMIAGWVADHCIAYAYHHWMLSDDKTNDELCFLS